MKRKLGVYLSADAGLHVDVEIDVDENASNIEIADAAYEAASKQASINDCEISDWTDRFEVLDENQNVIYASGDL